MPVRTGWVELGGTWTRVSGLGAYLEGGYRPAPRLGLFARGFLNPQDLGAVAGARWTF